MNNIKWFNTMAPALYEMVQARSLPRDPERDQIIAGHLKIDEDDVFLEIKRLLPKWKRIKVGYSSITVQMRELRGLAIDLQETEQHL